MSTVICRQCGTRSATDRFPSGQLVCPSCGWRELLPAHLRPVREQSEGGGDRVAVATAGTGERGSRPAGDSTTSENGGGVAEAPAFELLDLDGICALAVPEFVRWVGRLLERFGFAVRLAADDPALDCHIEATRGGETVLVDCIAFAERENVGRPECQKLVGAMVGSQVSRGMLVAAGAIEDGCRGFAEGVPGMRLDLVDGDHLAETLKHMKSGPLDVWLS